MAKKYRVCFRLPDGRRGESFCQTQAEANLTRTMVGALIASANSGIVNQDALEWASRLSPEYYQKLVRWGLLTERSVGVRLDKLIEFIDAQPKASSTRTVTRNAAERLVAFFGSNRDIRTIARADAETFCRLLSQSVSQRSGKPLAKSSCRAILTRVKYMFNEAVRIGWIDSNPFNVTSISVDVDKSDWVYVTKSDAIRVIENTPDKQIRAIIALYRFAGTRGRSELKPMQWTSEYIRWTTSESPCSVSFCSPKLRHSTARHWRTIPLPDFAERYISDWFAACPDGSRNIFGACGIDNIGDKITLIFRKNGIEINRAYNLRRSFCCDMMEAVGSDAAMYEALCGHSFKIGMQHYQLLHNNRRQSGEQKVLNFWNRPGTFDSDDSELSHSGTAE